MTKKWHELAAVRIQNELYRYHSQIMYRNKHDILVGPTMQAMREVKLLQTRCSAAFVSACRRIIEESEIVGRSLERTPEENQKLADLIAKALDETA